MEARTRDSMTRGMPVLGRDGRRIGFLRKVGREHLEAWRLLRPPLLVPLTAVRRLDRDGVHVDAVTAELHPGTLRGEGPATEVAPIASIAQARSPDPQRWSGAPPGRPQQDHAATGDGQ